MSGEKTEVGRGELVNGTVKAILVTVAVFVWAGVHIWGIVEHDSIGSSFDSGFATAVGAIVVLPRKQDKTPKD
jgi:hypothetical protein